MEKERILVADCEQEITDGLLRMLRDNGYAAIAAGDGQTALRYVNEWQADMVVMDLVMPDMTGEQLCRSMRKKTDVPIVILTARKGEQTMIEALEWGADDYLRKPVSPNAVLAKIEALLRRLRQSREESEVIGDQTGHLKIDIRRHMVLCGEKEVHLTPTEYKLLVTMVQSPNRTFTRNQLITYALEDEFHGYDRSIDTYIKELRRKIEKNRRKPRYICTVHGVGYKFVP